MIFAIIGFIFLAAGVGVTVGTYDYARHSGGKKDFLKRFFAFYFASFTVMVRGN